MIKINDISIKMGETEVKLSVDDAKELQKLLNELFAKEVIVEHRHYNEWFYRPQPVITYPYSPFYTYCGTSGSITLTANTTPDNPTQTDIK